MNDRGSAHSSRPSPARLTRRRVLAQATASVAAIGSAAMFGFPWRTAAQDATPAPETGVEAAAHGGVTPARVELVVDRLPALVQEILDQTGVPGMSVAVVYDDAVTFLDGFGRRQLGTDAEVDADTVFQLASVSKPIASTVVSTVVGDGIVEWSSRLVDIDPGFALYDAWPTEEVTLADLFAHRSGLPAHAGDLLEDLGFGRDDILHRLRYLEPAYSFRNGYAYTNFGLTAAAVATAQAAGMTWEDLSDERLYAPLGMSRTSSRFDDYLAETNRATPHILDGDRWSVTPTQRNPDAQTPAGGVSSTARDLTQWMRLQLGQGVFDGTQLIPATALAPTHVPQAVSSPPLDPATQRPGFYGLGWNVGYDDHGAVRWSHSGAFALGAATAVFLLPGAGFGIVALTNGAPIGAPEALCLSVLDLAQGGAVTRDWLTEIAPAFAAVTAPAYGTGTDWDSSPTTATSALAEESYLGTYHNAFYGEVAIVSAGNGLALRIGPEPLEFPLAHFDRDTFAWQPPGENAPVPSGLTFTIGTDGSAIAFADEYLASGGPGVLMRSEGETR